MALFKKTEKNQIAGLESELTATRRKRDDLLGRRDKLASALVEAEEARKAALLLDDDAESNAALAKAASACESYRSSLSGVDLLLAEHAAKIGDLETQIATGLDRQQRETKAAKLDKIANTIEALCAEHAEIIAKINAAHVEAIAITPAISMVALNQLVGTLNMANGPAYEAAVGNLRSAAQLLRADPPPKPAMQEPPPAGAWSGHRRKFEHDVAPGAIGDRRPAVYDAFAEK